MLERSIRIQAMVFTVAAVALMSLEVYLPEEGFVYGIASLICLVIAELCNIQILMLAKLQEVK